MANGSGPTLATSALHAGQMSMRSVTGRIAPCSLRFITDSSPVPHPSARSEKIRWHPALLCLSHIRTALMPLPPVVSAYGVVAPVAHPRRVFHLPATQSAFAPGRALVVGMGARHIHGQVAKDSHPLGRVHRGERGSFLLFGRPSNPVDQGAEQLIETVRSRSCCHRKYLPNVAAS